MIREAIGIIVEGRSLTLNEASTVMEEIMEGKVTSAQLGSFITALRIKGETAEEIAGLAAVMRKKAISVKTSGPVLDIVGTGGDGLNTFNISTAAAFVAAGAGIKIAKHGNRAASSQCGSADVLEKLGVRIDLNAEQVRQCIQEVGIGFMFAPSFHPAMKHAGGPRREIGIRTVFNILGPLTNPAHAEFQVIGVPNAELAKKIVSALSHLTIKHALVVHGENGMDEISLSATSTIWELKNSENPTFKRISPEEFGLKRAPVKAIVGGSPEENANILLRVFAGEKGAKRDIVILNAAAALLAAEKFDDFQQAVYFANEIIDRGAALAKLKAFTSFTQNLGGERT